MARKRKGKFSNTIYTYDIEVTSLFNIDGCWKCFDESIKDYSGIDKCSVPYISMFGINDTVYYFRDFMLFGDILEAISDRDVHKYIYVHSLQYEFQFLLNIIDAKGWHIERMCSRDIRKPIAFTIAELNIEFRCSYMLTNMKLATAAACYTDIEKKVGDLDYNKERSPLTELSDRELGYCEYDILCLYEVIKYYRDEKYGGALLDVPLTSTGEVRKAIKKEIDYWYIRKMWDLVPDRKKYLIYMLCFSGGYTHANLIHSGVTMHNVKSYDIASSYPSSFFEKFPDEVFRWCPEEEYGTNDNYAYIVQVRFKDLHCRYYNTYIQKSKMLNADLDDAIYDNGRLKSCSGTFDMFLCDIDFELIKKMYAGEVMILKCYKAHKSYLDLRILKFILKMYKDKTDLKGVDTPEAAARYRTAKACVNSLYGCAVTNVLKGSANFVNGQWQRFSFSDEFIDSKILEAKKSWSTIFQYTTGLYVTAYSRRNLMEMVLQLDRDVIYCDTDSIKYVGDHDDVFKRYNMKVYERYQRCIDRYPDLKMEDFSPVDSKGNKHTLGLFEYEGEASEFKTLGAKKYCFRKDGKLHLTLSGVSKGGVIALEDDIENFRDDFVFDYKAAGKLIHFYDDEQPEIEFKDIDGNIYRSDLQYGIILQPTTYHVGVTLEYALMLQHFQIKEREVEYYG